MPNVKISALPTLAEVDSETAVVPIVQGGVTYKVAAALVGGKYPDVEYIDLPDSDQSLVLTKRKTVIFAGERTAQRDVTFDTSGVPEGAEVTIVQPEAGAFTLEAQPGETALITFGANDTGFVKLMKRSGVGAPADLVVVKDVRENPGKEFSFADVATDVDTEVTVAARRTVVQLDVSGTNRTLTVDAGSAPEGATIFVNGAPGWTVEGSGSGELWEFDQFGESIELLKEDGALSVVGVTQAERTLRITPTEMVGAGAGGFDIQALLRDNTFLGALEETQRSTRRKVQTTSSGQAAIGSLPVPAGAIMHVAWRILGVQDDGSHKAGKAGSLVVHRNGSGNVTALDTQITIPHFKTDAAWGADAEVGVTVDTSSQELDFSVSGKAATTIDWVLDVSWATVTTAAI